MSGDYFRRWMWQDSENQDIPDSVEAFWNLVRDLNYDAPVEDGAICAVYQQNEDTGDRFEHVVVGKYNEHADAIDTVFRAGYNHGAIDTIMAETQAFQYEMDQIVEDGHRVASFDSGPGWRDGHDKEPIDIRGVPEDVMEQLQEYGTYWSGDDVLAVDRWDDRLMRFHGASSEVDDA